MPGERETREILGKLGVRPSRRLGQTFLVDRGKAIRIAGFIAGQPPCPSGFSLLEIGPGLGSLTGALLGLEGMRSICAVEICPEFAGFLRDSHGGDPRLSVIEGDFLRLEPSLLPGFPFDFVAGNLPYSESSAMLLRLLEPGLGAVRLAVLMLQREMAERASCLTGGKDYGRLALAIWPEFEVTRVLDAGRDCFYPTPAVSSRVVSLTRRPRPAVPGELRKRYERLVSVAFGSRRKTLLNNLSRMMPREQALECLRKVGIDPLLRAERLPPQGFVDLAGVLP
ncbi:16S rRNA (adenine(1518)-N(6)/adenine(1519)-N(6))-dimethyltransferase [Candidatus Fermentibacterales bacterium]|nr:16S rRNA (adenine(1518)-N(6)/adenine(1519)-N(6))-dimethyltransferase [Candidatus Fermentibacterales bacterium]